MKRPNLLKVSQLLAFIDWCRANGIQLQDAKGWHQILQVRLDPEWHAIYVRGKHDKYLTVTEPLEEMVIDFLAGVPWKDLRLLENSDLLRREQRLLAKAQKGSK